MRIICAKIKGFLRAVGFLCYFLWAVAKDNNRKQKRAAKRGSPFLIFDDRKPRYLLINLTTLFSERMKYMPRGSALTLKI